MPTTVTSVIDPGGGGDYTTLAAWESDNQADLTASDEIQRALCKAGDLGALGVVGWTTDNTRYVVIEADAGAERLAEIHGTGTTSLSLHHYGRVINMKIAAPDSAGDTASFDNRSDSGGHWHFQGCIIEGNGNDALTTIDTGVSGTLFVWNNVIYDHGTTAGAGGIIVNASGVTAYIYNNTIYDSQNADYGIRQLNGTVTIKNNLVNGDHDTADYNGTWAASVTNLSGDATSPQTDLRNKDLGFVDAANKDFRLTASDAADAGGTDLSADANLAFSTDILGNQRSEWYVGAYEFFADGGSVLISRRRRRRR